MPFSEPKCTCKSSPPFCLGCGFFSEYVKNNVFFYIFALFSECFFKNEFLVKRREPLRDLKIYFVCTKASILCTCMYITVHTCTGRCWDLVNFWWLSSSLFVYINLFFTTSYISFVYMHYLYESLYILSLSLFIYMN